MRARRRVFGAALEQLDALLEASAEVVPDAAPVLLFYVLSQAGRALYALLGFLANRRAPLATC